MLWLIVASWAFDLEIAPTLANYTGKLVLYDAVPMIEQDIQSCRSGLDDRARALTKDDRDSICADALREMTRLKNMGACRSDAYGTWSMCEALPPEWAQGTWLNSDETAYVEIYPVGFRYSWKITDMIFTGVECAFISFVPGRHTYNIECNGGKTGAIWFYSETEFGFDLMRFKKVPASDAH